MLLAFINVVKKNAEQEKIKDQIRNERLSLMVQIENNIQLSLAQVINNDTGSRKQYLLRENRKGLDYLLKKVVLTKSYDKLLNENQTNCTICLEIFVTSDMILELSCKHVFHQICLENWLNENILNPKCPNCNFNVLDEIKKIKIEGLDQIINYWNFSEEARFDVNHVNNNHDNNNLNNDHLFNRIDQIQILPGNRANAENNNDNANRTLNEPDVRNNNNHHTIIPMIPNETSDNRIVEDTNIRNNAVSLRNVLLENPINN